MTAAVSLLRGINVGGKNMIPMEPLQALYGRLGLVRPVTFIQSGNVVFETEILNESELISRLEIAIEREFGVRSSVILRSAAALSDVAARNPFAEREDVAPNRLLVTFLQRDPGDEARAAVRAIPVSPEELIVRDREIYTYFPNGSGRSKLPIAKIARAQTVPGTARNWNTVLRLIEMTQGRLICRK